MDFGKVDAQNLGSLDLSLPEDDPRNETAFQKSKSRGSARIGIGAPVWGVKEWVGSVYPKGTPPKDFLTEYARQFNSIELNTSYYRIPDPETIQRWREATPPGFKFNVKFSKDISHSSRLDSNPRLTREFCENVSGLKDRLGISFLQLPPHFSTDDLPILKKFLLQVPRSFPLAIEVRHPSFFQDHRLENRYYDLLVEAEAHAVITDVAGRRDVLHSSLPSPKVLVRFIGNDLHSSDDQRIDDWVKRLHTWLDKGLDQVEFFVHQPDNVRSPELITRFIDRLNAECGLDLPQWKPVEDATPKQLTFF